MQPRTENATPCVFPRVDFWWSLAMKVRPGDHTRMSIRVPRVFPRRVSQSLSRARVVGHTTADGKKKAAAPHMSLCRGKRVVLPAM